MRAVVTRVKSASVEIDGRVHGSIGRGFLVLLGVHQSDGEAEAEKIADRICGLRVFDDENGKMNISPAGAGAELLIVSQFTLFADCKKGKRPSFFGPPPRLFKGRAPGDGHPPVRKGRQSVQRARL